MGILVMNDIASGSRDNKVIWYITHLALLDVSIPNVEGSCGNQ